MKKIKKKAREMFDEKFKELNGKTEIWKGNRPPSHTDIKSFIDSIIDLAVSKERERIVERIKEQAEPYDGSNWHNQLSVKTIINLINTK